MRGGCERADSFVLPVGLERALRQLDDDGLDRLVTAAVAEARLRGRRVPGAPRTRRRGPALTPGQERMVLAAFDSGVKPAAIARSLRLSRDRVNAVVAAKRRT